MSLTYPSIPAASCRSTTFPGTSRLQGVAVSLFVGLASGLYPAVRAANLSVDRRSAEGRSELP